MKKRLNIHLYVTPICNLKCIHCYYEAKDQKFKIDNLLSVDELRYIIISLIDKYDAYFDIEGGELFLRDDIHKLFTTLDIEYLKRLTITTNGTVDFNYNQTYLKELDEFRISFEGDTDILQKSIRKISLKQPLALAKKLLKIGVNPTIRITLHKENFKFIKRMIDFFQNMGFNQFSFYEFQKSGRAFLDNKYSLSNNNILTILEEINALDKNILFKFSFSKSRVNLVKQYNNNYYIKNISNISSLTINYNGDIGICPWKIGQDIFMKFDKNNFIKNIDNEIGKSLIHNCAYCSYIRIENA